MPSPTLRRSTALCAAALIAVLAAGCGGKNNPVQPIIPNLTQAQADDMVQQFAMMMASDHGGWMTDLLSSRDALPLGGPPAGASRTLRQRLLLMPASAGGGGGFRTNRDTTFARAGMNYQINYLYTDTSSVDSIDTYHPGIVSADMISIATGNIAVTGFNAFYRHLGDPITITGLDSAATTLAFSGINDDSLFVTFTPAFRPGETRHAASLVFLDYELVMVRDPAGNRFPTFGEISADIYTEFLRTANPADRQDDVDGIVVLTFDGTETPILGITNQFDSVTPQFRYRVNLTTGAITRIP